MYSLAKVLSRSAIKSSSSFVSPSLAGKKKKNKKQKESEFNLPISKAADCSHVFS